MKVTGNAIVTLTLTKAIETNAPDSESGEDKLEKLANKELQSLLERFNYGAEDFDLDDSTVEVHDLEIEEEE